MLLSKSLILKNDNYRLCLAIIISSAITIPLLTPLKTSYRASFAFNNKNSLLREESNALLGNTAVFSDANTEEGLDLLTQQNNTFQVYISKGTTLIAAETNDSEGAEKLEHELEAPEIAEASKPAESIALLQKSGAMSNQQLKENLLLGSPPDYPPQALIRNLEGSIILELTISSHGLVNNSKVLQSTGHTLLDEEALKVVKLWAFKTSKKDRESREERHYTINFNFSIEATENN
jgi:TonB family protein